MISTDRMGAAKERKALENLQDAVMAMLNEEKHDDVPRTREYYTGASIFFDDEIDGP